jgi:hypothetical protein
MANHRVTKHPVTIHALTAPAPTQASHSVATMAASIVPVPAGSHGPSWSPVFVFVFAASIVALIVNAMSRRPARGRVVPMPVPSPVAGRPSRHQVYVTRQASPQSSPWTHRVVVLGAR